MNTLRQKKLLKIKDQIDKLLLMEGGNMPNPVQGIVDWVNNFKNAGTSIKYAIKSVISGLGNGLKRIKTQVFGHMESQDPTAQKMENFVEAIIRKLSAMTATMGPLIMIVTLAMAFVAYIWVILYFYNRSTGLDFFQSVAKILTGGLNKVSRSFQTLMESLKKVNSLTSFVQTMLYGTFKVFMIPTDFLSGIVREIEEAKLASFMTEITGAFSVCFGLMVVIGLTALGMTAALAGA